MRGPVRRHPLRGTNDKSFTYEKNYLNEKYENKGNATDLVEFILGRSMAEKNFLIIYTSNTGFPLKNNINLDARGLWF